MTATFGQKRSKNPSLHFPHRANVYCLSLFFHHVSLTQRQGLVSPFYFISAQGAENHVRRPRTTTPKHTMLLRQGLFRQENSGDKAQPVREARQCQEAKNLPVSGIRFLAPYEARPKIPKPPSKEAKMTSAKHWFFRALLQYHQSLHSLCLECLDKFLQLMVFHYVILGTCQMYSIGSSAEVAQTQAFTTDNHL